MYNFEFSNIKLKNFYSVQSILFSCERVNFKRLLWRLGQIFEISLVFYYIGLALLVQDLLNIDDIGMENYFMKLMSKELSFYFKGYWILE